MLKIRSKAPKATSGRGSRSRPLDETGEHVGGWPAINFEKDTPQGTYDFDRAFPREAKAFGSKWG